MAVCFGCTQKEGNAHFRLSKAIYNFTDTQDLRLAVGYRATVDEKGVISGVSSLSQLPPDRLLAARITHVLFSRLVTVGVPPCMAIILWPRHRPLVRTRDPCGEMPIQDYYGQLRENNWSLYTDFKGFVGARYDL